MRQPFRAEGGEDANWIYRRARGRKGRAVGTSNCWSMKTSWRGAMQGQDLGSLESLGTLCWM
jgi:hypothetical protein